MPVATFCFHAALNDFLPKENRGAEITITFAGHETVKHLVEALGVPHTEVDVILVDGVSVDFSVQLAPGAQVDVYPHGETLVAKPLIHLQPENLNEPCFVLDGHLGKLAAYLRLLGFDALYRNDFDDAELAEISERENRILLTRDRGLLKRSQVQHGYWVRVKSPKHQVVEVLQRYDLAERTHPFSRCARCNGLLIPVPKAEVYDRLEPKTKLYYDDFRQCKVCDQVYWKGSHFKRLEKDIQTLLDQASKPTEEY
jgi:uncharacterized protein with PIN domain